MSYIKKYGTYSFNEAPFNEVDNAILCEISYVSYENIINTSEEYSIRELSNLYFKNYTENDIKKDKSLIAKSPLVLKEIAKTLRYKDIIMHHLVYSSSEVSRHQFAAMQFDLGDGTTYVSFRGTDDYILGWKEDFEMAYKKIKGYKYAKNYINFYCSPFKRYRVGGHSKGGALAVYASTHCFNFKRRKIIEVYSNDGPGIKEEYIRNKMSLIADRYIKIVPENDTIGIIFDDDYYHQVVKSNAIGFFQHDMLSWQIKDNHFIKTKSLSNSSLKLRNNFNKYIKTMKSEEIIHVCDSLFNFLDYINITKVSDLFKLTIGDIPKIIKEVSTIDSKTKKTIMNIIFVFFESNLPTISFFK